MINMPPPVGSYCLAMEDENRKLDCAIAQLIFGFRTETVGPDVDGNFGGTEILVPCSMESIAEAIPRRGPVPKDYFVPRYSTNLDSLWPLVERFGIHIIPPEKAWGFATGKEWHAGVPFRYIGSKDTIPIYDHNNPTSGHNNSLPIALCEAALAMRSWQDHLCGRWEF